MSNLDIVRAWKDEDYRNSLTDAQRSQLPENPAGVIDMTDKEMEAINGASFASWLCNCSNISRVMNCLAPNPGSQQRNPGTSLDLG